MQSFSRSTVIGVAAMSLLLATVATGLFLGTQTRKQFREIADSWVGYAEDAEKKGVWISSIRGYLGYGGIIHNFKNYVLRGEPVYLDRVNAQLAQYHQVMANFQAQPMIEEDRVALAAIDATIAEYESRLAIAIRAAAENWPAERTDRAVRVDDSAAVQALATIERNWWENRANSTARIISAVSTGNKLIEWGFVSLFALVFVALVIGLLLALLLRDMHRAVVSLSEELVHRSKLEQSEKLLAEVVEQSPATIVITGTDGHIQYANRRFEELTGWTRDELAGLTPRVLQSGDTSAETYAEIRERLSRGEVWQGAFRNRRKTGGSYWADTTILPLKGRDGLVHNFVGIGEDTTERRRAREQVVRAQKIEAVGLLAGGIAHDFNNILTTIVGAAHLAAMDAEPGSEIAYEIEQIDIAARRAQTLVRQLLNFARREPGVSVATDLGGIVREVTRLLRAAIPATIAIETETAAAPLSALADPTHLHQILMNLCGNAAEAIGGKTGCIRIRTGACDVPPDGLPPRDSGWLYLSVEDDGPGMSPATAAQIFDPFFTTKPIGKGTGLGLAVVQGLVQDMGGIIRVESAPGQGARFCIYLPVADAEAQAEAVVAEVLPRGTEKVLIVDDEIEIASIFRRFLMRLGYRVEAFSRPQSALEHFRADPERHDLVILDMVMPEMSGEELAAEIRGLRPDCPILVCSAFRAGALPIPGPATEFIDKPVEPPELARRVRAVLDRAGQISA